MFLPVLIVSPSPSPRNQESRPPLDRRGPTRPGLVV